MKNYFRKQCGNGLVPFCIFAVLIGAWFTHVFTCLSDERWGFLIAGAIFFPVAVVHGVGIWFGAF